jgi:5'-nucleotidase
MENWMPDFEKLILLTNDDGVKAVGLGALRHALEGFGRIFVVAPSEEKSACSHSLTIHHPVRIEETQTDVFAVTGTPVDCVVMAFRQILPRLPDLVISGINHGANLGDDTFYSGTVAGAREAALWGVPAIAVSLVSRRIDEYENAAHFVSSLVRKVEIPTGCFLNVNIPEGKPSDFRYTRQGMKRVSSAVEEKQDPRGNEYYWIGLDESELRIEQDADYKAIQGGYISEPPST